jgi:hypothetical protein
MQTMPGGEHSVIIEPDKYAFLEERDAMLSTRLRQSQNDDPDCDEADFGEYLLNQVKLFLHERIN